MIASSKKILIVDDDQNIHDIYDECLTTAGFSVDSAFNGQEGLTKLTQEVYDLVLLDLVMPKVDGFGVLKGLRELDITKQEDRLIVIFSSLDQPDIINQALALGAKGYIDKATLTPDQAMAKINEFLNIGDFPN